MGKTGDAEFIFLTFLKITLAIRGNCYPLGKFLKLYFFYQNFSQESKIIFSYNDKKNIAIIKRKKGTKSAEI